MNNYYVAPDTEIYLLQVPFEMDEENVLSFSDATAQYNYFSSLPKAHLEDATFQRKDGVIRYPNSFHALVTYNYCMYKNSSFSNRWYYAFIEDIKFINTNMTEITLKTDVYQTWQFDTIFHKCFVQREHVNNDTIGAHTLPEGLETGEYVTNGSATQIMNGKRSALLVMAVSDLPSNSITFTKGAFNSIYSGLYYLGFLCYGTGITNINNVIQMYALGGRLDAIQSIFMCYLGVSMDVSEWTFTQGGTTITADVIIIPNGEGVNVPTGSPYTITRPSSLSGSYTPTNKKLLTYPYMYFVVSNNAGVSVPFRYEDFSSSIQFKGITSINVGGDIKLIPLNYKGLSENYENSINGGKYPVCSWTGDVYTNWLTQQSVNVNMGIASIGIGGFTALASGGTVGSEALLSGIDRIGNFLQAREQQKLVPDQVNGNINSGDINYAYDYSGFTIYKMSIKREYAKVIDDYFTAYGYQVNEWKIPNLTGRTNWNYVKTVNCNITGDIPQKDMLELKRIFNKGVTIWHNASTFLDYTQSNTITS